MRTPAAAPVEERFVAVVQSAHREQINRVRHQFQRICVLVDHGRFEELA